MNCQCTKPHTCRGTPTHYVYSTLDSYKSEIGSTPVQVESMSGIGFRTWKSDAEGNPVDTEGHICYEGDGRQPVIIPVMLTPVFCQAGAEVVCAQRNTY